MQAGLVLFAVLVFAHAAAATVVLSGDNGYKTNSKPIADRLFEIAMAANCRSVVGSTFPLSSLSNKGPLGLHPNRSLTTTITGFGVKVMKEDPFARARQLRGSAFVSPGVTLAEYGPVGGFVLADASDGSITIAFQNGWDDVYIRLHGDGKRYKYDKAMMCDKTCLNCATGRCLTCPIDTSFLAAYNAVKDDVFAIVDAFTRDGFNGPIFLTGYSLAGALALEAGLQMGVMERYQHRSAAVYSFGTPKVVDKACERFIASSSMGFFRVTWPGDYYPLLAKPEALEGSVTTLWYEGLDTLKVCWSCLRDQFGTKYMIPATNAVFGAINKPSAAAYNLGKYLLCKGGYIPTQFLTGSRRHCPEQTNVLQYAPSCRNYLPPPDIEQGWYQPLPDHPSGSDSKKEH